MKIDGDVKEILKELKDNYFKNKHDRTKYTYYNLDLSHKDFMIIIQNPGAGKKKDQEKIELGECNGDEKFIEICRKWLQKWIEEKGNKEFWDELIKNVQSINKKITKDDILEYFSITDVIKKREKHEVDDFEKRILKKEIETIKPKLALVCGSRAWDSISDLFKNDLIKINTDNQKKEIGKVGKEHGYLFKLKNQKTYIIPLLHFSNRVRINCPRNSYFDYMNEGFKKFILEKLE